ncbi:MAG: hypothetical protein HY352_02145 [Candidatus Omnitrophica bacterium]|nr:hypothetical protein [Candidatus Omnitrophota bacterium]
MRQVRYLSIVVIMGLLSSTLVERGYATPSTHIWAPSTDVQPYKKVHLTSDFYVPTEQNGDGSRANTITNLGLTLGVLPWKSVNAELGFDVKSGGGGLDDWPVYFNAKIGTPEDLLGPWFPALAVGIYDVGTKHNRTTNNVIYGKAAKTIKVKDLSLGRVSVGYFTGDPNLLINGTKRDNDGLLFAWERVMTELSDKLWVAVDYQGSRSAYGALNLGFSWKFSENVSTIFAYDLYNDRDLAGTYTVQVDIDF